MAPSVPDSSLKSLLAPGRVFEKKYRIINQLGTGSFAVVVKARHEVMGRDVALKCLKPSVVRASPEVSTRFVNEVRIVSRLRHPNTVTIFDFGETEHGLAYMVLEYLDGETLDQLIAHQGPMEEARALYICRQILKSLDEAHAQGIVHRDLKPSNIMLTELHGEPDFVKVLDFGVAKLLSDTNSREQKNEPRSTQFIGTPIYMSPEQVLGQSVAPASDLYSLGLLLYQMLSGESPIAHESVAAVVREHLDPGPLPFKRLSQLSPEMQQIILTATQRAPSRRFASVADFLSAMPFNPADMSSEHLRIVATKTRAAAAPATQVGGLAEETSEPDVFSGKNYIEMPEPAAEFTQPKRATAPGTRRRTTTAGARDSRPRTDMPARKTRRRPGTPVPSLRTDDLALDLESINRQRRRVEHQRRRPTPAGAGGPAGRRGGAPESDRARDSSGFGATVLRPRLLLYVSALAYGYVAFVILGAMMHGQASSVRSLAGLVMLVGAVLAGRFSGTRAVGGDFGQRWLIPTARNLLIIGLLISLTALLVWPADTAAGLAGSPTWFLQGFSGAPPFSWVDSMTSRMAETLATLFRYSAALLPY